MLLTELLSVIGFSEPREVNVNRLITDSRRCQPGDLFIGMPGTKVDGSHFALETLDRGAVGAVVSQESGIDGTGVYAVDDIWQACALLANAFYGYPTQSLKLVGVTGTNGKTTTAHLVEFLLQSQSSTGLLGTLYTRWANFCETAQYTTPFAVDLQATLRKALDSGVEVAVMEVSSHALHQKRVGGCTFDRAVFTNLTQDHLDYHHTLENYFAAKALLFTPEYLTGTAILNWDDEWGRVLSDRVKDKLTYSLKDPQADLYTTQLVFRPNGVQGDLHTPWGILPLRSGLVGSFNVLNTLAAIGVALSLGVPPAVITDRLPHFQPVPGRLELVRVSPNQDITVVVDYAHTPDGLENVLQAMRPFTHQELICVFGCGGDRDRTKRPIMGAIAHRLADRVFVTSDNPRTEDPEMILNDIRQGITTPKLVTFEPDRRLAILGAILHAQPGDTIVIAGKGHEDYQIIGTTKFPFDDRDVARSALEERLGL